MEYYADEKEIVICPIMDIHNPKRRTDEKRGGKEMRGRITAQLREGKKKEESSTKAKCFAIMYRIEACAGD